MLDRPLIEEGKPEKWDGGVILQAGQRSRGTTWRMSKHTMGADGFGHWRFDAPRLRFLEV